MAYDILMKARTPLHVSEFIDRIQTQFGLAVDRESLVSSLSKKVARQDRFLRGGDHISFNEAGYPAVRFTEYREDFNHQHQTPRIEKGVEYGDLPKFVNFDYVASVARVNAATLASLAYAPALPAKVRLQTRQLENDSTLTWEGSPGDASYEVV